MELHYKTRANLLNNSKVLSFCNQTLQFKSCTKPQPWIELFAWLLPIFKEPMAKAKAKPQISV